MYIPRVCELLEGDIENLFTDKSHGLQYVVWCTVCCVCWFHLFECIHFIEMLITDRTTKSKDSGSGMAVIGDISELKETMDRMNSFMMEQDEEREMNKLWRLCMLSLLVDDDEKFDKIKHIAQLMTDGMDGIDGMNGIQKDFGISGLKSLNVDDYGQDMNGVCDLYLQQMAISMDTAVEEKGPDEQVSGKQATVDDGLDLKQNSKTDIRDDESDGGLVVEAEDETVGGLIGAALSGESEAVHNALQSLQSDADANDPLEFQGDKIVFRSGEQTKGDIVEGDPVTGNSDRANGAREVQGKSANAQISGSQHLRQEGADL